MMKDYQRGCLDQRYFVMAGPQPSEGRRRFRSPLPGHDDGGNQKAPAARPGLELVR
jgi:hypothetical protein